VVTLYSTICLKKISSRFSVLYIQCAHKVTATFCRLVVIVTPMERAYISFSCNLNTFDKNVIC